MVTRRLDRRGTRADTVSKRGVHEGRIDSESLWVACRVQKLGSCRKRVFVNQSSQPIAALDTKIVTVLCRAALLTARDWSGASPDNGRFPVRPFSLTPSAGR